ncbi:malonyl-coa synthase [Plakobranchus ocellatus]|uniref:Medium-chain acyl-CoA ligase ACSF2, mitochondrial n=1 Tax=Plakobranchus ocellatus TaxID=259542 RepID=A0AAV3YEM3_9GAST|nr:malonyl-coa synthase [Plakobranchus ocellatus]
MSTMTIPETETLIDRMLKWRDEDGEKEAFVFYNRHYERSAITRKELVKLASRFAYILKSSGIGHKDVVVNTLPNGIERVVTDMGITMAGAAPINSMPSLTSGEIFFSSARRSHAKAAIVSPNSPKNSDWILLKKGIVDELDGPAGKKRLDRKGDEGKDEDNIVGKSGPKATPVSHSGNQELVFDYKSKEAPEMTKLIVVSRTSPRQRKEFPWVPHFLKFLDSQGENNVFIEKSVVSTDVGFMFTTTGTTGMQKIVPRTHKLLIKIAQVMGQMTPGKLPAMFYTTRLGWNSGFPYMFYLFGSTCVMLDELDSPEDEGGETNDSDSLAGKRKDEGCSKNEHESLAENDRKAAKGGKEGAENDKAVSELYNMCWRIIKAEKILFAYLSPKEIDGLAASAEKSVSEGREAPQKLLIVATGGLPIKHNIASSAVRRVCGSLTIVYGMTEAGVVSSNVLRKIEDYIEGDCGRLFRGVKCRITDDSGKLLPPGQAGNVQVSTETIFEGFFNNVEKTREAFTADGWYITADMGFLTPDGTLTILCRKGNVILHGSVIVYPTAVENVLRTCPGVQDVVVVPVPNEVNNQNICACVIRVPGVVLTEEGLKESMDSLIALPRSAEIPVPQHVIFLDTFPLVQDFKVDRKQLQKMATDYVLKQK